MSIVNRQELKYFITKADLPLITAFLESALIKDSYSINSSYKISSLYFDTINDDDFVQKLDGIMYREKYRIRIYNDDLHTAKFEIKRKLNNCIQKISSKITKVDVENVYYGDYSPLEKYENIEYVSHRMAYLCYQPINIVTYDRKAYLLPINNIRVTIDSNLRTHGFHTDLSDLENLPVTNIQKNGLDILEIKYENSLPSFITDFLSSFKAVRSSVSKYALSRVDSNTEIHGDDPVIPF
jgi:hypothetical protein